MTTKKNFFLKARGGGGERKTYRVGRQTHQRIAMYISQPSITPLWSCRPTCLGYKIKILEIYIPRLNAHCEIGVTLVDAKVVAAEALVALHLDLDLPSTQARLKRKTRNKL